MTDLNEIANFWLSEYALFCDSNPEYALKCQETAKALRVHDELMKENAKLRRALTPRSWSLAMDHAWHRGIPSLHKAFRDLTIAAIKDN